ncbi:hypothetical protein [Streptomyces sp. NPDC001851]|uniref:hypothetical protein n=1 Tax=Streptomyces sp. NPDC001851 TaxID=3154529 RepID=UPI003317CCC6
MVTGPWARDVAVHTGRWLRFGLVLALAVVLHAAWDSIGRLTGYAVIGTISLLFLGALTHRTATPAAP